MSNNLTIRPVMPEDEEEIRKWNEASDLDVELELPQGLVNVATETAIAENDLREKLASLTGTIASIAIVLDPLIKNPKASKIELMQAIVQMARALEFYGAIRGATEAYIAIPDSLPGFQAVAQKLGYELTAPNCTVFRRLLFPTKSGSLNNEVSSDESND